MGNDHGQLPSPTIIPISQEDTVPSRSSRSPLGSPIPSFSKQQSQVVQENPQRLSSSSRPLPFPVRSTVTQLATLPSQPIHNLRQTSNRASLWEESLSPFSYRIRVELPTSIDPSLPTSGSSSQANFSGIACSCSNARPWICYYSELYPSPLISTTQPGFYSNAC
jgi:hypothetical protein